MQFVPLKRYVLSFCVESQIYILRLSLRYCMLYHIVTDHDAWIQPTIFYA